MSVRTSPQLKMKSSEIENGTIGMHVLPRSYLAQFENPDGILYANKFKGRLFKKIISSSANGVCFRAGYYKMPPIGELDLLTTYDALQIDKYNEQYLEGFINFFYENPLPQQLKVFRERVTSVTVNWKFQFCQTLLHLFVRNFRVRESIFKKDRLLDMVPDLKDDLMNGFTPPEKSERSKLGISFDRYLDILADLWTESVKVSDMGVLHNNFIINQHFNVSERKLNVLWRMVQGRWDVLEAPQPDHFIVTDNPSNMSPTELKPYGVEGFYQLFFPLNTQQLLRITTSKDHISEETINKINYLSIQNADLQNINRFLANNCNMEIYCSERITIESLRKHQYSE